MKKYTLPLFVAAVVGLAFISPAFSQSYPDKPIKLIVPTAAGTIVDLLARVVGENITNDWGQQVVVTNEAGAGGSLGVAKLADAAADGYTLGFVPANLTTHPSLFDIDYDVSTDFIPVSLVAGAPLILYVGNDLGVDSVSDLIALAKENPGSLTYASAGEGSITHLASALFNQMAGVEIKRVPYTELNLGVIDVVEGRVSIVFTSASQGMKYVQEGKLKALGLTSSAPTTATSDLIPIADLGLPGFEIRTWFGLVAPAGVPHEIIDRLHAEMEHIGEQPAFVDWLQKAGVQPVLSSPDEFKAVIDSEIPRWAALIEASGASQ